MQEHVSRAHRAEDIRRLIAVADERRMRERSPGRLADIGVALEVCDLPQVALVE
jgi:hypothetical protein